MKLRRLDLGSWSTFAQTALLIFAALAVSQVFAFFILRGFVDRWHGSMIAKPSITRFADVAASLEKSGEGSRTLVLDRAAAPGTEFALMRTIALSPSQLDRSLESDLAAALKSRNVHFLSVFATRRGRPGGDRQHRPDRDFQRPPPDMMGPQAGEPAGPFAGGPADDAQWAGGPDKGVPPRPFDHRRFGNFPPGGMNEEIWLAAMLPDGNWLVGRFAARPWPALFNPIFVSQVVLFVVLLAASLFWASRISRPLRTLARAAETLRPQERFDPIAEKGPRDVRTAIVSFNAMAQRVRDLLQEKDRMLSAIGHDLRTPLASLRIRAETIEPESEREKLIESIDEMTAMVEEILGLARLGHSTEKKELVDLTALADTLVEEYRELGRDVSFEEAARIPLQMQAGLVRRLLRNLIDNALKYGVRARVSLHADAGAVELRVDDDGPGIPESEIGKVMEPFQRLENSRSRETGGLGLGLSIARAVAQSQGAELMLRNREGGGLCAIVCWPRRITDIPA